MNAAWSETSHGVSEQGRLNKVMYSYLVAFIGLEMVRHLVLMRLSMGIYHAVGGALSIALAVVISKVAVDAVRHQEKEFRWSDRVARVMAASVMVSAEVGDPVSGLAAKARSLLSSLGGGATRHEFEQLQDVARRAENVERILRSLALSLSRKSGPPEH